MKKKSPSSLELQVLSVLWRSGPATVRQLLEAMPDRKKRAYTTLLSVVQVMEKKHLVTHSRCGVRHVYHAAVKERQILRPVLRDLVRNIFGGKPARAMQFLLDETDVSDEQLAEIRGLVAEMESPDEGQRGKGDKS